MTHRRLGAGLAVAVSLFVVADRAPAVQAQPPGGSRLHWVTNGPVTAGAVVGTTLYVGGNFTRVGPTSSALGAVHALSTTTGAVVPLMPLVDGEVRDVEPDGAGGYYLAGRFTSVGGQPRAYLARVLADGSVDETFAPVISAQPSGFDRALTIESIALNNGVVYLAFRFGVAIVNGTVRSGLAAVDATSGASRPAPSLVAAKVIGVNGQVVALGNGVVVLDTAGNIARTLPVAGFAWDGILAGPRLVLAGQFLGPGDSRPRLTALDWITGLPDLSWPAPEFEQYGTAYSLATSGSTLYVGGEFSSFLGQPRFNLAAVDVATGALTSWAPSADGIVETLAITPGGVLAGGSFVTINGTPRERLAEISNAGTLTPWQSATFPTAVHTLHVNGGSVIVGGRLAIAGGVARTQFAAFDLESDSVLPWAPDLPGRNVVAMAATTTRVFAGTELASNGQRWVSALDAVSGAELPWQPTPLLGQLVGVDGPFVYLQGFDSFVTRRDAETGTPDPWFRAPILSSGIVDGILYGAAPSLPAAMIAVDLASGLSAPWQVPLTNQFAGPGAITLDGSTAYATFDDYTSPKTVAFDARSGVPLPWAAALPPVPNYLRFARALAAVDDRIVLHASSEEPGAAVTVVGADGQPLSTALPLTNIPSQVRGVRALFATPTDLIVLGVERASPLVHGIAVIPRTPAAGPHALRWSSAGNRVTLSWNPGAARPNTVLTVGSTPLGVDLLQLPMGAQTSIAAAVASGPYFARVVPEGGAAAAGTNRIAVVAGCVAAPRAPTRLIAELIGGSVRFAWTAPPTFTPVGGYVLEAGTRAGVTDVATIQLGPDDTTFTTAAPAGTYYVRTRAVNACGRSAASADVLVTVGASESLPPAPNQPTVTVAGRMVTLQWPAVSGASGYAIEAGSAPQLADLVQARTTGASLVVPAAPPGIYHVRVRAATGAGLGPPSGDVVVAVH